MFTLRYQGVVLGEIAVVGRGYRRGIVRVFIRNVFALVDALVRVTIHAVFEKHLDQVVYEVVGLQGLDLQKTRGGKKLH